MTKTQLQNAIDAINREGMIEKLYRKHYGDDSDLPENQRRTSTDQQLEYLLNYFRSEIESECISTEEIIDLQSLAEYIDPNDTLLLQWAGVPERN